MINRIDASLESIVVHRIGRASENEGVVYSESEIPIAHDGITEALMCLLLDSFTSPEYFTFNTERIQQHTLPLLNPIQEIFNEPTTIVEHSKAIAKLLYQHSENPNIKDGDLLVAYIRDVLVDDELVDGLAIVKVENLQAFLRLHSEGVNYNLQLLDGIAINKVDKACLIFNTEAEQGYKICAMDKVSSTTEAKFWMQDFLSLQARTDDFYFTKNYIQATKQFIQDRMKPIYETDTADEAVIMNRSLNFLTHEEDFDANEYERRIFKDEAVIADFQEYKEDFANERDVRLAEDFKISPAAIKNQSKVFKSVLKLDKNFHVYIHGNRDMIEKGVDEMGRKFYKLFYNEED